MVENVNSVIVNSVTCVKILMITELTVTNRVKMLLFSDVQCCYEMFLHLKKMVLKVLMLLFLVFYAWFVNYVIHVNSVHITVNSVSLKFCFKK